VPLALPRPLPSDTPAGTLPAPSRQKSEPQVTAFPLSAASTSWLAPLSRGFRFLADAHRACRDWSDALPLGLTRYIPPSDLPKPSSESLTVRRRIKERMINQRSKP